MAHRRLIAVRACRLPWRDAPTVRWLRSRRSNRQSRRIFLRLIQFGEGRADTRRQQAVAALRTSSDDPALFDETLRHLADNRLVTLSGEEQATDKKADLAHEALISGWPQLL